MGRLKNVIFLGRKPAASKAISYLVERGINVKVVAPLNEDYAPKLRDTAERLGIPLLNSDTLYKLIQRSDPKIRGIDLVVSYLFWDRIKYPLIGLSRLGCINFHPAPLPDYKSRAGYNTAILDKKRNFGVSAHFIDSEKFDSGPIIKVLKFKINPEEETAYSLEKKAQDKLLELFKDTIDIFSSVGGRIPRRKNEGGNYLTAAQLESLKEVDVEKDSIEDINRKIRAFFFPPYSGAKVKIRGHEFTIVNDEVLRYIHKLITHKSHK